MTMDAHALVPGSACGGNGIDADPLVDWSVEAVDASEGFDAAFTELWPCAYRAAYRVLRDASDAEDAAAEALAKALAAWHRVGRLEHREAWVLRVTTNAALDLVRKRSIRLRHRREPEHVEDPADDTVTRIYALRALRRLPRRQREVLALRYLLGLKEGEVAEQLGVNKETVRQHRQRGLRGLKRRLVSDDVLEVFDDLG